LWSWGASEEDLTLTQIGKKEAVERLLVQAVKLHFNDGDEFATHLLLMSAFRICRDIVSNNRPDYDPISSLIRPDWRKSYLSKISEVASYLKHADKDWNSILEVPYVLLEQNETFILITAAYYELAFETPTDNPFIHLAMMIMIKKWPNYFVETADLSPAGRDYCRNADLTELVSAMKGAIQNPSEFSRLTREWPPHRWSEPGAEWSTSAERTGSGPMRTT
jgi:hypothetical protein